MPQSCYVIGIERGIDASIEACPNVNAYKVTIPSGASSNE
jgi:hypothetical protein